MKLVVIALLLSTASAQAIDLTLPDSTITPGVVRTDITQENICKTLWGKDKRHVTSAMKRKVFTLYGLSGNDDPACLRDKNGRHCEIDHLISRELGGADDTLNLWPQPYGGFPWNAVRKDRVENRLHKEVCEAKSLTLEQAQKDILDYRIPYRRYFGEPRWESLR